jgi:D-hexose-6-phosphate mutarotase
MDGAADADPADPATGLARGRSWAAAEPALRLAGAEPVAAPAAEADDAADADPAAPATGWARDRSWVAAEEEA